LGAAYLAGLAVGYWKNMDDIKQQWQIEKAFENNMDDDTRSVLKKQWHRAVQGAINF
jgi:glycerol kinase